MLGNFDAGNPELTEQFLTLSVFLVGRGWCHLARYHDLEADTRGPAALAAWLNLAVEDVFPIQFDLRGIVQAPSQVLQGVIRAEPRRRLSRAEVIALAVP